MKQELVKRVVYDIDRGRKLKQQLIDIGHRSDLLLVSSQKLLYGDGYLKKCACGMKYFFASWIQAEFIGYYEDRNVSGEMRNCSCKSTLLVITKRKMKIKRAA